jgi:hypothetical protein
LHVSLTRSVTEVRKGLFEEFWEDDNSDGSLQHDAMTAADEDAYTSFQLRSPLFASPTAVTAVSLPNTRNPITIFEQRFQRTSLSRCLPTIQLLHEDGTSESVDSVEGMSCMAAYDSTAMVQSLTWNVRYNWIILYIDNLTPWL